MWQVHEVEIKERRILKELRGEKEWKRRDGIREGGRKGKGKVEEG